MPENNIIEVNTWEEFEKRLKDLQEMHRQAESSAWSPVSRFLFRGQENSCWPLTTTLERRGREGMLVADYCHLISDVKPEIETFTGLKWDDLPAYPEIKKSLREEYDSFGRLLPYDYMVHLRHHGFPSPLLDWTKSPYIAAFFALRQAPPPRKADCPEKRVSIYVYWGTPTGSKTRSNSPEIYSCTPRVQTPRHDLQQCEYTICAAFDNNSDQDIYEWRFGRHEEVFARGKSDQDVLLKYNIPATERLKVLKLLDDRNINAFSLFESEESLMETVALRELDLREGDS